jgi:hypothetical protein
LTHSRVSRAGLLTGNGYTCWQAAAVQYQKNKLKNNELKIINRNNKKI